jgi:hypothetical protein
MIKQISSCVSFVCTYRILALKRLHMDERVFFPKNFTPNSNALIWIGARFALIVYYITRGYYFVSCACLRAANVFFATSNQEFRRARALLSMVRVNKSLLPQAILRLLNYIALLPHIVLEFWRWRFQLPDSSDNNLKESTVHTLIRSCAIMVGKFGIPRDHFRVAWSSK